MTPKQRRILNTIAGIIRANWSDQADVDESWKLAEDLKFDSLDRLDLLEAIEDEYSIVCTKSEAFKWVTVGDVVAWVEANT